MLKYRIFSTVMAAFIAAVMSFVAGPVVAADIVLKAGHSQNAGEPMDKALHMMREHVEAATGG